MQLISHKSFMGGGAKSQLSAGDKTERQSERVVCHGGTFQRVSVSHLAADEDMPSEPEWLKAGWKNTWSLTISLQFKFSAKQKKQRIFLEMQKC